MPGYPLPNSYDGLQEFNPCHEPGGSSEGGRFARKGEGECTPSSVHPGSRAGMGGKARRPWSAQEEAEVLRDPQMFAAAEKIRKEATTDVERRYAVRLAEAQVKATRAREDSTKKRHTTKDEAGDLVYTPERLALHGRIVDGVILDFIKEHGQLPLPAEGEKPEVVFLTGPTGAGKSTARTDLPKNRYLAIDPDEIKERIPEYGPLGAAAVQDESGDIADRVAQVAANLGINVIIEGTGKSSGVRGQDDKHPNHSDGMLGRMAAFKQDGYKVVARHVGAAINESVERAVTRFIGMDDDYRSGKSNQLPRYVPPGFIRDALPSSRPLEWGDTNPRHHTKSYATFHLVTQEITGLVDSWMDADGIDRKILAEG